MGVLVHFLEPSHLLKPMNGPKVSIAQSERESCFMPNLSLIIFLKIKTKYPNVSLPSERSPCFRPGAWSHHRSLEWLCLQNQLRGGSKSRCPNVPISRSHLEGDVLRQYLPHSLSGASLRAASLKRESHQQGLPADCPHLNLCHGCDSLVRVSQELKRW